MIVLGIILKRRLAKAKTQKAEHQEHFNQFSEKQSKYVPDWLEMVKKWEKNREENPNPYVVPKTGELFFTTSKFRMLTPVLFSTGLTEADVKLKLAEDETALVDSGVESPHEINASAFVVAGLDLQDHQ